MRTLFNSRLDSSPILNSQSTEVLARSLSIEKQLPF